MSNSNENEMNMAEGKTNIYVNLYGKVVQLDKIYLLEAEYPCGLHKLGYNGILGLSIKRSSILDKALQFCKKRAEIRARYSHDETRLYHELRHFGPDFLKDIQGDDAIDLLIAASVLDIKNLVDLMFDDVVRMISDKTPQDIEKIFRIRYNGDDTRFDWMNYALDNAFPIWHLKKLTTTDREILKVSPAVFKNLPFEQQQYWVYGHILLKRNETLFKSVHQLSKEDEDAISAEWKEEEDKYGVRVQYLGQVPNDNAYEDEDEDEDEDVLKTNDDGGIQTK